MLLDPQKLEPRVVARRPVKSDPFQGGGVFYEQLRLGIIGERLTFYL